MAQKAPTYRDRVIAARHNGTPVEAPPHGFDGATLLKLRTAAGMSQLDLAARLGTSLGTISDAENGKTAPRWITILRLGRVFDVDINVFAIGHVVEDVR